MSVKPPALGQPARPDEDRLVFLGTLTRTQGIQGGIRLMTEFENFDDFENLKTDRLFIKPAAQTAGLRAKATGLTSLYREVHIREFQPQHRFIVVFFDEAPDMNAAELLRGHEAYVYEEELWDLPEGKYYTYQMAGLEVYDLETNQVMGTVKELRSGVQDYLIVDGAEKQFLIPYVPPIIEKVDLEARRITVRLPEGITDI